MLNYSLFDTLLEPVFVLNAEQKIVYCNETAALLCELSIRKLTRGLKFLDIFTFSDVIDGLDNLPAVTDPTPYKELNFKTSQGGEGKVQITLQPIANTANEPHWIVFVRDVTLEERLQKKYRAELEQKEDVIKALEDAKAQLENYSKNLEQMVAERTAEIQRMNQTMTALLDSLNQGFFIFDAQGKVLNVSSKACERTVEGRPDGKNIWDVLKLEPKELDGFRKWMQILFSEMLPFEDLSPLGPESYRHSEHRNISLEYFPLRCEEGKIDGVVVVASDITSLVEARKQAEHDRAYAKMIINLIQNKREISRFIRESQGLLSQLQKGLQSPWEKADPEFLFRQLHTLKGGAALFSVQELADHCHEAETLLAELKESPNDSSSASATKYKNLQDKALKIASDLTGFVQKSEEVLGGSALSTERQLEIPVTKFQQTLLKLEASLPTKTSASSARTLLMSEFAMEEIGSFFSSYNEVAQRVAESQDKSLLPLQLENAELKVLPEIYTNLFASFVHAVRNSVDHGIESPYEREQKGKPTSGTIKISFSLNQDQSTLQIRFDDDGAGIDPLRIREKLKQKNRDVQHENDEEVIQHIFDSQFSTREQVTDISGRGVGMDAIKHCATELGGRAWVSSEKNKGTSLFVEVPYVTQFSNIPKNMKAA